MIRSSSECLKSHRLSKGSCLMCRWPMRGVKMTFFKPGRSGRMSVWQLTEYFKSDFFFSKPFLRWGMHAFRFSKWKWRGFLALSSVLPSVIGSIRESEICHAVCCSVWSAGYLYHMLNSGSYFVWRSLVEYLMLELLKSKSVQKCQALIMQKFCMSCD